MGVDNYINSMAKNCHQVYQEMTGQKALGANIDKIEPPFDSLTYQTAIVIPYENKAENFEGRFILGLDNENMAVKLATEIAEQTGMPALGHMDDMATDILFEFMNTVAGKVITDWDKSGMTAEFFPPEFITDLKVDNQKDAVLLVHSVTLSTENEETLSFLTILEEIEKSALKDKKILVVDDSKMIRFLLATELEKQGCHVIQAENGLEGVVKHQAHEPDLIIMDLIMPKMGGLEAIAKIRELQSPVKIIILTSTSKKEEVQAAATYKVKGFIKKPLKMDQLLDLAISCFE